MKTTIPAILKLGCIAFAASLFFGCKQELPGQSIYISPSGSDSADGSKKRPFATFEKARDVVRTLPKQSTTIWIAGGDYYFPKQLELSVVDSGTASAPITWRAVEGQTPRLIGAQEISAQDWRPVTDPVVLARLDDSAQSQVLEADVEALGIKTIANYPDFFVGQAGLLQLFYNTGRMPISRWPNGGYTTIQEVTDSGMLPKPHGGTFIYRDDRAARWTQALEAKELWVACFWRVPWVIEAVRVASMDQTLKSMTLAAAVPRGIGSKYTPEIDGTRKGSGKENYYVFNLLEEIDQPGEWCYRFATKKLYFWPPKSPNESECLIASGKEPIFFLNGASHITVQGLQLVGSLTTAISIQGGESNVIADCKIEHTGGDGITILGGRGHRVQSCDLSEIGGFGIKLEGGNLKTLTPSGFVVDNTHIQRVGNVTKIVDAIQIRGVGTRLTHNLIHDVPSNGIQYFGNDHLFEYNELHNIGLDSGDLGAFYTNDTWASRGNILRHNFIHHSAAANAIYLDDGDGGDEVTGNLIYRTESGLFVSGGPDNLLRHNLVIDCKKGIHIDDRGIARGYNTKNPRYMKPLEVNNYKNPPWSTRYPVLVKVLDSNPELPNGTIFEDNFLVNCAKSINAAMTDPSKAVVVFKNNPEITDASLAGSLPASNFVVTKDNPLYEKLSGWEPLASNKMGLYADTFRKTVPTRAETGGNAERKRGEVFNSEQDLKRSNEIEGVKKN